MKRNLVLALVLGLTLGVAGVANAALIDTSTVGIYNMFYGNGYAAWSFNVTPDLTVPYDIVNSASLDIKGWYVTKDNINVKIEQSFLLDTIAGPKIGSFKAYDLTQYFQAGWGPSNGTFDVVLLFNQANSYLFLNTSTLTIDYTNQDPPISNPEPGTMMLLGSGLIGLAVWGRKKVKK